QRQVPHSRRNSLAESALTARGYQILSRLGDGGVDLFTRSSPSLFVFSQGHPEYGAATLGPEYLRDGGRFLRGEAERPAIPENYFDRMTEDRLAEMTVRGGDDLPHYNAMVMGEVTPM